MKNKCPNPCFTRKYILTEKSLSKSLSFEAALFRIVLDNRAMTVEMLLGNIGGTLGLFLGISCISAITAIQYIATKIIALYKKKKN